MELNAKSCTALEAIAEGHSYEQILAANPHLTYKDIFAAAAEALDLLDSPASKKSPLSYEERMAEIRELSVIFRSGLSRSHSTSSKLESSSSAWSWSCRQRRWMAIGSCQNGG